MKKLESLLFGTLYSSMEFGKEAGGEEEEEHAKLNPETEWARIDRTSAHVGDSYDESDDESGVTVAHGYEDMEGDDILWSNDELVVKGRDKLLPGLLEYSRLMNANSEEPSNGPINSVQFHWNGQLLLTAGLDRRLRFFQVDENTTSRCRAYSLRTA
ncbi:hypothetical protein COCNU_05G005970 [Cocos nucifera]|uniref:Uncharacterized protein n=1 Tax=Cocos nucifera TaxID=13894 RepID=A0A8K0I8K5_COCNU|nr:hypothetical protein COCNU_05G005970 [Cocos nucifera]